MKPVNVIPFKRGQSFSYSVSLPASLDKGFFSNWALKAEIRKKHRSITKPPIAEITATWIEDPQNNLIMLQHHETDQWPLGEAVVDVLFTSPTGQRVRSKTLHFRIVDGITQ